MIIPPSLNKNDLVAVTAPAKAIPELLLKKGIEALEKSGLKVQEGKYLRHTFHRFAGTDEERLADFQDAVNNPDIKAIFCARGGYGSMRIIDKIDFKPLKKNPKWIIGFSDITAVHNALHNLRICSVHGAMPLSYGKNPDLPRDIIKLVNEQKQVYESTPHALNRSGTASGQLVGGNLTLLSHLTGTPYDIDTRKKLLLLEDVGENLYKIDRMMQHLKLAGKLDRIAGLLAGTFNNMDDDEPAFGKDVLQIIKDAVNEYDYPVAFNIPAGHDKNNKPFILGAKYGLQVNGNNTLLKLQ